MRFALARETEGSYMWWKPCDSYRFRPNENIGARLIDGLQSPLEGSLKLLSDGYRSALHPAVLGHSNRKFCSTRAHKQPRIRTVYPC